MKTYKTYLFAIVIIVMATIIIPQIMSFFDVSPSSYITYIHWFTMLGIFTLFLPSVKTSVFS